MDLLTIFTGSAVTNVPEDLRDVCTAERILQQSGYFEKKSGFAAAQASIVDYGLCNYFDGVFRDVV